MVDCREIPYEVDFNVINELEKDLSGIVVIQLPPGLKPYSEVIAACVEDMLPNAEVVVHGDPTYGACDLSYPELSEIAGANLIIHVGHTPYPLSLSPTSFPRRNRPRVVFVPARSKLTLSKTLINKIIYYINNNKYRRILLTATIQHTHQLQTLATELARAKIEVIIPQGKPPYLEPGQILGCDYSTVIAAGEVDAYVFLGGGLFHPLGLYLTVRKPVLQVDPYRNETRDITLQGERTLRVRLYKVMRAFDANNWGLITGLKTGQYRPGIVRQLTTKIYNKNKKYRIYLFERLGIEDLRSLPQEIDAFVVASCPRLAIDDLAAFEKPVLTPGEARMALEHRLEPYLFPW